MFLTNIITISKKPKIAPIWEAIKIFKAGCMNRIITPNIAEIIEYDCNELLSIYDMNHYYKAVCSQGELGEINCVISWKGEITRDITEDYFFLATGKIPELDDIERSNCKRGNEVLHSCCGWDWYYNLPRFMTMNKYHNDNK